MLGGEILGLIAVAVLLSIAGQVWMRAMRFYGRSWRLQRRTTAVFAETASPAGPSPAPPREPQLELRPRERAERLEKQSTALRGASVPLSSQPRSETQICASCRGAVLAAATSCRHCGALLGVGAKSSERA